MRGLEVGGNEEFCAFLEIFRGVIVELAVRNDFTGDAGLRIVIAEDGDFDFAGGDGALDENFHGEFGSEIERGSEFLARVDFGHADAGAERGGLYENGIGKFLFDLMDDDVFVAFPIVAVNAEPGNDGNFRGLEQLFGDVFVHGNGGAQDACADERKAGELEEALDGAVFAEGPVHDGEDDVDALAAGAAVEADEGGVGGIGAHGDALAGAENFGK